MATYPLALLPVVTISGGRARIAPQGYGQSDEIGSVAQSISSWVHQGAAWIHIVDQDAIDGGTPNHHIQGSVGSS